MAQAKGVYPRNEDRDVLKDPRMCGYFIGVKLNANLDRARTEAWFGRVQELINQLVKRDSPREGQGKGDKVATVAVGLASSFFLKDGTVRFDPPVEVPASFTLERPLPNAVPPLDSVPLLDTDVLFYVASVYEARVNAFVSGVAQGSDVVVKVTLERGYQREDGTEPFGYRDGLRNVVPGTDRPETIFVHRGGRQLDEPAWADGGSYMAYLKIRQHPDKFAELTDDPSRDAVIGRTKQGERLDLQGQHVAPKQEPGDVCEGLPPTAHVRKVGPRGGHDDTQIYRRGLPYMEIGTDGEPHVGLHFCSFQASLDQFDVVFNDWSLNPQFPSLPDDAAAGQDALLNPDAGLTTIELVGFFFVPPYHEQGLAAAVLAAPGQGHRPKTGRLVVHKRVQDPTDPNRRFERRGFVFQVVDAQSQPVGAEFTSDSTGRAVCLVELEVGQSYILREVPPLPVPNVNTTDTPFTMDKSNLQLSVTNAVTQSNSPYGGL